MKIKSNDSKQLTITGDKGDYILLIPINSQLEESLDVCTYFTSVISKALQDFKKLQEKEKSEPKKAKNGKRRTKPTV